MIVRSKAPLRLGFAGGGTDISPYCDKYTGYVLNGAIKMYVHCTIDASDNNNTIKFISDNLNEEFLCDSKKFIKLDGGSFDICKATYNRIVLDYVHKPLSFSLYMHSEAPSGSGLGGSSTLIVAIIKAFTEWLELSIDIYDIAQLAYKIEREDLGWSGGKQDQYAATFGGVNFMKFYENNHVSVNPLGVKNWILNELESSVFIGFTGISRKSSEIIDTQKKFLLKNENTAIESMHQLKDNAVLMKQSLLRGSIQDMADILDNGWKIKKNSSSNISNNLIDDIVNTAKNAGAWSCKVSGAGGGGFIIFMTDPLVKAKVMRSVQDKGVDVKNVFFDNKGVQSWKIF